MLQPVRAALAALAAPVAFAAAAHADVPAGPRAASGGLGLMLLSYALGTLLAFMSLLALVALVLHLSQPNPRRAWFLIGITTGPASFVCALVAALAWGGDLKPAGYALLAAVAVIGASTFAVLHRRRAKVRVKA